MSGIGLKLASLFLRQISKPIANTLKAQAKDHAAFKRVCISIAQRLHRTDVNLRMRLMGENGAKVRPLNDKKAIDNGADFLSETFVFAVAGSIILYESYRQRQKELTRRESVADDIKTLQYEIQYLKRKLREYNVRLDDYVPPDNINPSVLKLDKNGDEIDLETAMDNMNARIKLIEKEHADEVQQAHVATPLPIVLAKVVEPKVLKDLKELEKSDTKK